MAEVNGHANGHTASGGPLNIIVVGAGIGGLTAAIGLRRNGHTVTVYEQSRFANELGAAIHVAPNANGILLKFGLNMQDWGANKMEWLTEYSVKTGETVSQRHVDEMNRKMWQYPWLLAHRIDLHESLKRAAAQEDGKGTPVKVITGSKVTSVDCESATITLANGEQIKGDVVIGADGVHSKLRDNVLGKHVEAFPSGKSAFRFLMPRTVADEHPLTKKFAEKDGELSIWYGSDRRIVIYKCRANQMLNFVCIHPDQETDAGVDWNNGANKKELLSVYEGFPEDIMMLLEKADVATLKKWALLDLEELPTWTNGRCALLGDAAHPFLPHQGQGAGIAIEDGAALSVVLPLGTKPEDIPERLQLYQDIRKKRASTIQEFTRDAGKDLKPNEKAFDMQKYSLYNFGFDEWDNSTQIFAKWQQARNPASYRRMPVAFGPMPGPRQKYDGSLQAHGRETFRTGIIKFKSSKTFLQGLFPTTKFTWQTPGTIAFCTWFVNTIDNMQWLGGSGYSFTGMYIHGVRYTLEDGTTRDGSYLPILWENLADPIVSGREELGMPKLYCAIDIHTRTNAYFANMSWKSALFGSISLRNLIDANTSPVPASLTPESVYADDGELVYKYIPAVGATMRGKSDVEYAVFIPKTGQMKNRMVKKTRWTTDAKLMLDGMDWEALPTLHHVVGKLEEMPVFEIFGGMVVEGEGVADVGGAVRIE